MMITMEDSNLRPREQRLRDPAFLIATWFGSGLLPRAPGTWGSLAALPAAWFLVEGAGRTGLALAAAAVFVLGVWSAERCVRSSGRADPGFVVVDEVCGQWLSLLVVPQDFALYLAAFALFRIFDIFKPWPVSWAERRFAGGLGVMLDDVAAAGYAAALLGVVLGWRG